MNFEIREAEPDDFYVAYEMIQELAQFVNHTDGITNTVDQMKKDRDMFRCFIAYDKNYAPVGMALVFFTYSTWVGKMLYLEDLIVKEAYRRQGAGKELLNKVFSYAREHKCKRVRWQALQWNKPAYDFYSAIGASLNKEIMNCDFNEKQIADFHL